MSTALVEHVHKQSKRSTPAKVVPTSFNPTSILETINVYRVHDEAAQTATIYSLPEYIRRMMETKNPVKILIVDSIAFHYRCSSSNYKTRTKSLATMAAFLGELASNFNIAVIVINQMTTKMGSLDTGIDGDTILGYGKGESNTITNLVPALGESWAHATTTRLLLMHDKACDETMDNENSGTIGYNSKRICKLVKSPHKPAAIAYFIITENGLRDCPSGKRKYKSMY